MTYIKRGLSINAELSKSNAQSKSNAEGIANININNNINPSTERFNLSSVNERNTSPVSPKQEEVAEDVYSVNVLTKIIQSLNRCYFNTKFIDNILCKTDLIDILQLITGNKVDIILSDDIDCKCCLDGKLDFIRDINKISVHLDSNEQVNFKYVYNHVYETLINDFHINLNKCFNIPRQK